MVDHVDVSAAALRRSVADLFDPKPAIYWLDLCLTGATGWLAFSLAVAVAPGSPAWVVWTLLAILALYRAAVFTHELVHIRKERLPGFRTAWNLICGVPLLAPSFMYDGVHQEHHFRSRYGTSRDGEYLPFGTPPRSRILVYFASHLLLPPLAVIRFGLLAPLSLLSQSWRRALLERASSLSIDPGYHRSVPDPVPASWARQEFACAAFVWAVAVSVVSGQLPLSVLMQYYVTLLGILLFNAIRTLAAHRYRNRDRTLSFSEQLADSINVTGGGLATVLLAPVGLRYHALHHLFPTMPYHSLGAAHRRLLEKLPAGSAYHETLRRNIPQALRELWRAASTINRAAQPEPPAAS